MACNRETSSDGSTSSATPVCQSPANTRVPCCNSNCRFFGCAATMNFCSKCYSEQILKPEGTEAFLNTARDTSVETHADRLQEHGADEANVPQFCADKSNQGIVIASSECGARVDTASADASSLQIMAKERSSLRTKMMRTSPSVSDLSTVFGLVGTTSSLVEKAADMLDLPQQPIPSPLSLSPPYPHAASPPAARQVETKLSLPPLVPARQEATNRCLMCRKRVGLLGFKCRCGDIFCARHRYSDKHDCSFDYKAAGRAAIARENPVVRANKIERI